MLVRILVALLRVQQSTASVQYRGESFSWLRISFFSCISWSHFSVSLLLRARQLISLPLYHHHTSFDLLLHRALSKSLVVESTRKVSSRGHTYSLLLLSSIHLLLIPRRCA